MKIYILVFLSFCFTVFPVCKKDTTMDYIINLHIEGRITYSHTNKPVANCEIELWREGGTLFPTYFLYQTESDEDGRYVIRRKTNTRKHCVGGYLTLRVYTGKKFRWSSDPLDQYIACTEELQIFNIEIDPL